MRLEDVLGRRLSADDRETVKSLNDLLPWQLDEARRLKEWRLAVVEYLQHYVVRSRAELDHVADFVRDVLEGGEEARTWRLQDLVCIPKLDVGVLARRTWTEILTPLDAVEGERWWQCDASVAAWDWHGFCGAPAVLIRRAPYWWQGPDDTDWSPAAEVRREPVEDLRIAIRRWIASRIAWELRSTGVAPVSPDDIRRMLRWEALVLSDDGVAAMTGLAREWQQADPARADRAPGFRGPDDWYEGS